MTSLFLTRKLAEEAVQTVLPAIMELMKARAKRAHLHIVVLDPTIKPWNSTFEDAVLYEHPIGNPQDWMHDYMTIARGKAQQGWRTQLPNGLMQLNAAVLLEKGDVKYTSCYVDAVSGMTVGCSGIQGYFDYLIGGLVAIACLQLAHEETVFALARDGDFFE